MTGTGVQNDPFIISSWADFITAVGTTDAYVEFPKSLVLTSDTTVDTNKLYVNSSGVVQTDVQASDLANLYENTFVLDANDYAPEGLTATIAVNCKSINGYGGCIKNVYSSSYDAFTINNANFIMDNVRLLNFFLNGSFLSAPNGVNDSSGCTKCIFSALINNGTTKKYFIDNYHMFFKQCSFYLILRDKTAFVEETYPYFNKVELCKVYIDADNDITNVLAGLNTYFAGTFPAQVHATMPSNYTNLYCIYDIYCPSILAGTWSSPVSTCICNIDKCTGEHQYLLEATTAQLKDAAYLASLGFPIQT